MKTVLPVFLLVFMVTCNCDLNAQNMIYPIPSFNVKVIGTAIFQESRLEQGSQNNAKERRAMNVKGGVCGLLTDSCSYVATIYSLDGLTRLGPFTVQCGETLTVEIDDREWGVIIFSGSQLCVDVWIEEFGDPQQKCFED